MDGLPDDGRSRAAGEEVRGEEGNKSERLGIFRFANRLHCTAYSVTLPVYNSQDEGSRHRCL